jgi:predicted ferric reductase
MMTPSVASTIQSIRTIFSLGKNSKRMLGYLCLIALPFLATYALDMQDKTFYAAFLSMFNTLAMMVFFIEFPLAGRLKSIPLFSNINWNMTLHKKIGQWLGIIFLLHPILILGPRFMVSFDDGIYSLMTTIKAPQMLTGIIAWVVLIVWVLVAVFKKRLNMRYEVWRFLHMLGFVFIAIMATLHITTVGSHGQFENWFNWLWWVLCTLSVSIVLYNYIVKPSILKSQACKLVEIKPVSTRDWQVTIEKPADSDFDFEPGQFVWMNTSAIGGVKEHPFSIASAKASLPKISFIIRNLGDYTSKLYELKIGQNVYIDGPYGSMNLNEAKKSKAIILIAGGAGIGPILSLLRELNERKDPRPIRLIYGNNKLDQMVLQDQIKMLEVQMRDFKQQLVCKENHKDEGAYQGLIDLTILTKVINTQPTEDWAVYMCGPELMINAVNKDLKKLKVSDKHIHYERLSF